MRVETIPEDVIVSLDKYYVRPMSLSWPKLMILWEQLKKFKTLFSDLTRGDLGNFIKYVSNRDTLWLEVWEDKGGERGHELVGIISLEGMHQIVDAEAHVLFLDRELADKVPICKATIKWLFQTFPLHRLTVQIPTIYYAPVRMVRNLGFKPEGKKRQAVLISGKWQDVFILGLTRSEVK